VQKLSAIARDFKLEGHPLRTFRRKVYANLNGHRPERKVYEKYMKPLLLNVGTGIDYIQGAVNIDNFQLHSYTVFKTKPDLKLDACEEWPDYFGGKFNTVLASHLWEHLPDPKMFFRNAWRALAEYGHLIIIVPNYEYMGKVAYYRDPTHIWQCPGQLMVSLIGEMGGWEIVQMNELGKHYKFSFDLILKKV